MLRKTLLMIFLFQATYIIGKEINVKVKLDRAKVFLSGVELTHSASLNIPAKGNYDLVFEGLASVIADKSLQVSAKGDAVILSAKSRVNYLKAKEKTPIILALEDSLKSLNFQKAKTNNENEVLRLEIELLNENRDLGGDDKGVTVNEIKQMAKFYRERLQQIKSSMLTAELRLEEIQKNIKKITQQLNELNKKKNKHVNEIVVSVVANKAGKMEFELTYLNYNARWNPIYNIRAKDISSPVTIGYGAEIRQNSGLDWNDSEIILSTRNPRESGNKPELLTWYIDFAREYIKRGIAPYSSPKKMMELAEEQKLEPAAALEDFITINETQLAVEFKADINYSIPSDAKPHSVSLSQYKLPAKFEYYAAPKLDSDAFLVAYVKDWKKMNLLPGNANIYFENSYVGQSVIDPYITDKELVISLGRDKNIVIERKLMKDFTEDKFLSSDIEREFGYEIKVRNDKKSNVKLILEDQLPISKNEDIKVELKSDGGAKFDQIIGKLKWEINLKSAESINKQFVYSVRYPADKRIPNL